MRVDSRVSRLYVPHFAREIFVSSDKSHVGGGGRAFLSPLMATGNSRDHPRILAPTRPRRHGTRDRRLLIYGASSKRADAPFLASILVVIAAHSVAEEEE